MLDAKYFAKKFSKIQTTSPDHTELNSLKALGKKKFKTDLYCANLEIKKSFNIKGLSDWNNIDSEINILHKGALPGINKNMAYVSTGITLFPAHVEDLALSSASINLFGASKMWIIVKPESHKKLQSVLSDRRQTHCPAVLNHKDLFATRDFLNHHGIQHEILEQKAGDIVITLPGTPHWGLNTGANVAIAVNFATEDWPAHFEDYVPCISECSPAESETYNTLLPLVEASRRMTKLNKDRREAGTFESTDTTSSTASSSTTINKKQRLEKTTKATSSIDNINTPEKYKKVPCPHCDNKFSRTNMAAHIKNMHTERVEGANASKYIKIPCPICSKQISKTNMAKHNTKVHT